MKLLLKGHDSRYAMEQIMLSLFPAEKVEYAEKAFSGDGVVSTLSAGDIWLTATTRITRDGKTVRRAVRCRRDKATEALRRQILRQSFYRAALPFLDEVPAWGALSGVRPTKLVSRHLMAGGTLKSADRMLREVYDVSEPRRKLCLQAAKFTMGALEQQRAGTFPCMWGYPFVPPGASIAALYLRRWRSPGI